jgi:two-component system sensor histidine kinase BaeS
MKGLLATAGLVVFGLSIVEVVMQPNPEERLGVALLFALMALGSGTAAKLLPPLARRVKSIRYTIVALGGVSILILALAVSIAGRQMFIAEHDLSFVLVLFGFGVVAALTFGAVVSGPLTADLSRITNASSAIAGGDFEIRTGVGRRDEVGELARSVDSMAEMLQDTERTRQEEERARRDLFASVSHDLRTPLASMRAAAEALQDGLVDEPDHFLESLNADVKALDRLVDDLFLLTRLDLGDIHIDSGVVDLTEIADEAIEVFRPIASVRDVSIRLETGDRVLAVGGSDAVARVVRNLLDNAVRHSPTGGVVVVTVENGEVAQITVTDQGAGFSPVFVNEAFQRFRRGDLARDRASGGAGLGLAIAHGYVTAMGGRIRAKSGPGGEVSFWLPGSPLV